MDAIGIEGREADLRRFLRTRAEHDLPIEMLYDQFAPAMGRGQHEHPGCEHAGRFFGIAVVDEEAAGIVDKKLIEVGRRGEETVVDRGVRRTWQVDSTKVRIAGRHRNRLAHTEPEGYVGDKSGQRLVPVP
jgi:hypothetical protein